jgi:hypothetical protein
LITENLSTLKIHKLTQEQYEKELKEGRIDPNAIYLTPDDSDEEYNELLSRIDILNNKINKKVDTDFATTITNQIAKKTDKQDVENIIEAFVFPSILLQSPNGNKFKLTVSDDGTLSTELVEEVNK